MNNIPEPYHKSAESNESKDGAPRHESLQHNEHIVEHREQLEQHTLQPESVDDIRNEVLGAARESAVKLEPTNEEAADSTPKRQGPISKQARNNSFIATMHQTQRHMSAAERTFSKLIHNKTIEQTSEVVGKTIARPNAILYGAIFAFIVTILMYTVAKNTGFRLSGTESIGAFIAGWILGLLYDFIKTMITGNR